MVSDNVDNSTPSLIGALSSKMSGIVRVPISSS